MSSEKEYSTARELTKPFEAAMNKRKERWTAQEDQKLAEAVAIMDLNSFQSRAQLEWQELQAEMDDFLSPNINRGNISEQEEDLIIRLQKLLEIGTSSSSDVCTNGG